ncbi:oxygen oxidoreductase [Trichoderma arundinaceum]|uniref:Oxygen oxidoreductase n=1 Tax=Trichoderma arundinaceum TaxID=490622 RepID=A0A395NZH0_TRIAR|nr:oxygen oxidoreductase [Trichoderma arundinaceum]
MPSFKEPVIIVGAGAFGLSTAWHLCKAGYTDITVLERGSDIPSPYSAANDLNKIIRAEYEDPFYRDLALEAINSWRQPLFAPHYHQTGYILATSSQAPKKSIDSLAKYLAVLQGHQAFANEISLLNSPDDFRRYAWQLSGPMRGFKGYFNRIAGYAHSSNAIHSLFLVCVRMGIKFITGEQHGNVVELLYEPGDSQRQTKSKQCVGVKTADGKKHFSRLNVLALGAFGASLIPELGAFATARSWSVAHIQLSVEEAESLRGIPVVNIRDLGFFFEPDPKTRLLKLCHLGAGFTNTNANGVSLPPGNFEPSDFMPGADEKKLRTLLREVLPELADRPFVNKKLCWFSDTATSDFCIDFVPGSNSSLVVLAGDSGHGFKMVPIFGEWVVKLLENGNQKIERWQWPKRLADASKEQKQWGNNISWRVGEEKELSDLIADEKAVFKSNI